MLVSKYTLAMSTHVQAATPNEKSLLTHINLHIRPPCLGITRSHVALTAYVCSGALRTNQALIDHAWKLNHFNF